MEACQLGTCPLSGRTGYSAVMEGKFMKKIKIVFLHYCLVCGGAEKALFDLITLLDKDKFEVEVFVQQPGGEWDQKFIDAGIKLVYDYSCRRPTWNPVKKLGNLRKKLAVKKALKNQGAGLLNICCPGADIVVNYSAWDCDELPFVPGAKTVKYIHGDPANWSVYGDEARQQKALLSRYDRIVCVSKNNADSYRRISGLQDPVIALHNPLYSEQVHELAKEPVELPQGAPLLCAVGRLAEQKAFERLIVIHKRLLQQGVFHNLVIVGEGPDHNFLDRLIRALEVEKTVTLAGYQANPYPYMKNCTFLVSSSLYEGLPVIVMEGLSLGIPVVAPIPSVAEAFGDEFCGLITDNTMEALEEGIRKMLTDEDLFQRAKAGAEKRSVYLDGKHMVREVEEMFLSLMEE